MTHRLPLRRAAAFALPLLVLAAALATPAAGQTPASPFAGAAETVANGIVQLKGMVPLPAKGVVTPKRFVLRYPAAGWNGGLVIGAHGGSGGNNYDATGKVIGTDETALDDVIGGHAVSRGFAYASADRDGAMTADEGLVLTTAFANLAATEVTRRLGRAPARRYLLGLSMGGGIARAAAETVNTPWAGIVIVAGANGDLPTRVARQKAMAEAWPAIDPKAHPGVPDTDPRVVAFAEIIGTPVAARRLWPYTASGAVRAAANPAPAAPGASGNSVGVVRVPTIEVAGTWDDFVLKELRAYRARVQPQDRHRLYLVEGVWHMSGDDDGTASFMFLASRMGLDPSVAQAMHDGPSYIPTVQQAFDRLVAWVERGEAPPPTQTVRPGQPLQK
ncbi:MAG: alpha/beta hydrolase domain-containing protein [Vicinamibacterales bacterium]